MLGIGRYCRGEKLLAYFNFDSCEHTVLPAGQGEWYDPFAERTYRDGAVPLPPGGFVWLLREEKPEEESGTNRALQV